MQTRPQPEHSQSSSVQTAVDLVERYILEPKRESRFKEIFREYQIEVGEEFATITQKDLLIKRFPLCYVELTKEQIDLLAVNFNLDIKPIQEIDLDLMVEHGQIVTITTEKFLTFIDSGNC